MTLALHIAITADPEIPVPPQYYGGIERVVDMLVRGLVERGHRVTLFAHPASDVPCGLDPYPGRSSGSVVDLLANMWHVSSRVLYRGCDLVHSFGRLSYLLPLLPLATPKIMSYQRAITPRVVRRGARLARGSLHFTGCSRQLIEPFAALGSWHVVYNGVPTSQYRFQPTVEAEAPLVFLGRIEEIKGPHLAIEVARRSGRRLILAGNVSEGAAHRRFFDDRVAPYLDDEGVRYLGPVDDGQKCELLGRAAALLMPVLWQEPFGIVMAEALACGTPVVGFARGSVPEVIQSGVNGFVCETLQEMVTAVGKVGEIDRALCRQSSERRFSDEVTVESYLRLYRDVTSGGRAASPEALR